MDEDPPCLHRVPLAAMNRQHALLADILAGVPRATALFDAPPGAAHADRVDLSAALVTQQAILGGGEIALANARRLADPATSVVTVGQQPGLLTGPLYTIYKAVTAITLARRLGAVPVFWVGADDDDRAEIDHCALWDSRDTLRTVQYPADAGLPGMLVGDLPISVTVADQAIALLAGFPGAADAEALLRETLRGSADLGSWFARLLSRLFASWGLVLCDPRDPALRRLAAPVLRRELARPLETTRRLQARVQELHRLGYRPALTKPADVANCFLLNGQRQRITFTDGLYAVDGARYAPEALLALLEKDPGRFVPNAVLRPAVQEYLFGSAAFIAGPNEVAYWAELAPVFQALDIAMPRVVARAGATIVPHRHARRLRQWAIAPLDLLYEHERVRLALLDAAQPEAVREAFTLSRVEIARVAEFLAIAVASVDATLTATAAATRQRLENELERLERKTLNAVARHDEALTERLAETREALFPGGGLQERALNVFSLIARHGEGVIERLVNSLDGEEGQHLFLEL